MSIKQAFIELVGWFVDGFLLAAVIVALWAWWEFADQFYTILLLLFAVFGILSGISLVIHYHWERRSR